MIAAGGMLGASTRYGLAQLLPNRPGRFPWATFTTNLAGCFLLGLLAIVLRERLRGHLLLRPFLATGLLGAFTTMSTYQVETALLVADGHLLTGFAYGVTSIAGGLALAALGIVIGMGRGRR